MTRPTLDMTFVFGVVVMIMTFLGGVYAIVTTPHSVRPENSEPTATPAFVLTQPLREAEFATPADVTVRADDREVVTLTREAQLELQRRHERLDITSLNVERLVQDQDGGAR